MEKRPLIHLGVVTFEKGDFRSTTVGQLINRLNSMTAVLLLGWLCVLTNDKYWIELLVLDDNTLNHLTVTKQMSSDPFKNNVTCKQFAYKSKMCVRVCKQDLALNNAQGLICHKPQPNQINM